MSTDKFTGMAQEYAKYRPAYPENLYKFLYHSLDFSQQKILADIGAGTGKFSLPLLENGYKVYCIEPNQDMKDKMDETSGVYENYVGICASAERTTLANQSVDHIVCAQAFHWFHESLFKEECRRILKPGGNVVLIWNTRDANDEMNKVHYSINKQYCPEFKTFSGGYNKIDPDQFNDFFSNCPCDYKVFENTPHYESADIFIGRCLTGSYAPKKSNHNYTPYVDALKNMCEKYASHQDLMIKSNTVIYWGTV